MTSDKLFETALGISAPWHVAGTDFDLAQRLLKIRVDFAVGSRFAVVGEAGAHPVHDTVEKSYRHLNFFQHECHLQVRVPRVKLPDGRVRQVEPAWAGKLSGFTLLFEALILALSREMSFSAVARIAGLSVHRVMAICHRYVDEAVGAADYSAVTRLAIDETSRAKGHAYVTLAADAERHAVIFVAEGKDANTIEALAGNLRAHHGRPTQIDAISIDMSAAFIKGVSEQFPNAQVTFDKFHVIAHASEAIEKTRRLEQKIDPALKGLRWALLKDRRAVRGAQRHELDALLAKMTTKRTARAWHYREQLRDIMTRKQPNIVRALLNRWCSNVLRSKVEAMRDVAGMVRNHFEGILAWVTSRQTNGFLEAINGLFQAAKRKARGYGRFRTIRTVIFLIAGKLDFSRLNPYVAQPT
jgi:transposase